jgi:hypothetical protein
MSAFSRQIKTGYDWARIRASHSASRSSPASSGNKKDMAAWITIISALAGILAGGVVTYATSFMQTSETYMIGWRAPLYQQYDSALSVTCHTNRDNSERRSPG